MFSWICSRCGREVAVSDSECPSCGPAGTSAPRGHVAVPSLGVAVVSTEPVVSVPGQRHLAFQMMTQIARDLHTIKLLAIFYFVLTVAAITAILLRQTVT
jgi:hypothetical protein